MSVDDAREHAATVHVNTVHEDDDDDDRENHVQISDGSRAREMDRNGDGMTSGHVATERTNPKKQK